MRFPGFSGEWVEKRLEEVAEVFDGTHQTPKYVNEGVKFVSVENIDDLAATDKYITPAAFKKDFKIKPRAGDILMTRITAGIIGATAIIQNDDPLAYYVSLALIRVRGNDSACFLEQRIQSAEFKRELHKRIIHVAFPKKINLGDIQKCLAKIPPLPEQEKISSFLTLIDHRISTQNKIIENLNTLIIELRKKIFRNQIRFINKKGTKFPKWQFKKLGQLCEIIMGQSPPSDQYNTEGYGLPLIQGNADIKNRVSVPRNFTTQVTKECFVDDLLLTVRAPVGAVAKSIHNACIGRGVCAIRSKQNAGTDIEFIFHFLIDYESHWTAIEQGSTFTSVKGSDISNIMVPYPINIEQSKLIGFLSSVNKKIENEQKALRYYQNQKVYLMQRIFI